MNAARQLEAPSQRRKIFSLESLEFLNAKNLELTENHVGKVTNIRIGSSHILPLHTLDPQNEIDKVISQSIDEVIHDINFVPWLTDRKHAETFVDMLTNEIQLCLASGLYRVFKKFNQPLLISKAFDAIKKARDQALEASKIKYETYQLERHFSVDTNIERSLVTFCQKLRRIFASKQFLHEATAMTRRKPISEQPIEVDPLHLDLQDIDASIPYTRLHERTLALHKDLPEIVHLVNTKHQIRCDVLKEFGNYERRRTSSLTTDPPPPPTVRPCASTTPDHSSHFTSFDIAEAKAHDHPLIQASIARVFNVKCMASSSPPVKRYLSKTLRRAEHASEPWTQLVTSLRHQETHQEDPHGKSGPPLAGIGQARFHHISSQQDIGLNIWDLVHWLMDDDREGGYGPEADYDVARSQEVEELFEEILRTNPQNHYTLTEPLQAHKYPSIPPSSTSSRLMHPVDPIQPHPAPMTSTLPTLTPPPRPSPAPRQPYHPRQGHDLHVPAHRYLENRRAAMQATPSSRPSHSKYNFGGYVPQVIVRTKHHTWSVADYVQFVQRFPTDFVDVSTKRTTMTTKDVTVATPVPMSVATRVFTKGVWQFSTLTNMALPYAERFQRVCRRLGGGIASWTGTMQLSQAELHAMVKQWEMVARCILKREHHLAQWIRYEYSQGHPERFWLASSTARMDEARQRQRWLEILRCDEHQVKNAIVELKKRQYHGPVIYQGQDYLEKMSHDRLDLLHKLTHA